MSTPLQKTYSISLAGILALIGISMAFIKFAAAIAAFVPAAQPVGFVAQDEVSNYDLTSGGETLFRPEYEKEFWSGNLFAYPVNAAGNVNVSGELWPGGAQAALTNQNFDTGRKIATMKDDGTKVPFRWANLSTAQQSSFGGTSVSGDLVLNFVRGDRSNEDPNGAKLRKRKGVLGAAIHSRPYYVSDAISPTIFLGTNDGMLHAFDATVGGSGVGAERWGYVPSMLISKLKGLVANPYVFDYYVDGQINIAQLPIGSTAPTQRILVGGLGSGGKGLFALDITSLTATSEQEVANKILWEIIPNKVNYATPTITNAYTNLGYIYGTPLIAKVNGTAADAIIVGNGYNDNAAGDYQAYLYVINATTGQLIQKIKAGVSGTSASPNGLYSVNAIDTNGDGTVDIVYGGDLNGTLWKFDLTSTSNTAWSMAALHTTTPTQPITSTPSIALHPKGGYMVCFGTGAAFTAGDLTDGSVHYAYGIWDGAPAANTNLISQTLDERLHGTTRVRRILNIKVPNWNTGGDKGWKVALPGGERILGEGSFIESGRFYFNSYNPTVTYAVPNTSTTITGENWLMELDYLSGGSKNQPFLDMDGDLLLDDDDRIKYIATDSIPTGKTVGDPIADTNGIPIGKWLSFGVQSQPILVQLQTLNTTLFNQNPDVSFPPQTTERGVAGGHFDVDNYLSTACDTTSGGKATGTLSFNYSSDKNPDNITIKVGNTEIVNGNPSKFKESDMSKWVRDRINNSSNYTAIYNNGVVYITATNSGTAYNGTLSIRITGESGMGESVTGMSGGSATLDGNDRSTSCKYDTHTHQYDDTYDKTGLNMLNASKTNYNLSNHISSTSTQFKVLLMNQYLSPAVSLHIDTAGYDPASGNGYISVKNYQTSDILDITTVPSYTRDTIQSLALNMPVDAFKVRDWWGTGDQRVGLHPTQPGCVWSDQDSNGKADLYQPVIPPTNGINGPGINSTTQGARHNGALTVQIIKANTPQAAIEQNVAGRPEYGWRVKSNYYSYVIAEYNVYWHHPNGTCYGDTKTWKTTNNNGDPWNTSALMNDSGWKKDPPEDIAPTDPNANKTPAAGSTDPKLGTFGGSCANVQTTTTTTANVTSITSNCVLAGGSLELIYRITKTENVDGSVTVVTTLPDGTSTTEVIANASGTTRTGGDERGLQARTGRISWHELVR